MLLFALGAGLVGAFIVARHHRRHHRFGHGWHRHHGCHGHGHGHHRGFGRGRRRWVLGRLFERIDATPAQERALVAELDALEERLRTARQDLSALRPALGDALRAETLDATATAGLEASVESIVASTRASLFDSLRKIHALLDGKQRALAAELLGGAWRGAGPYRV